jgi:hypothetical protein
MITFTLRKARSIIHTRCGGTAADRFEPPRPNQVRPAPREAKGAPLSFDGHSTAASVRCAEHARVLLQKEARQLLNGGLRRRADISGIAQLKWYDLGIMQSPRATERDCSDESSHRLDLPTRALARLPPSLPNRASFRLTKSASDYEQLFLRKCHRPIAAPDSAVFVEESASDELAVRRESLGRLLLPCELRILEGAHGWVEKRCATRALAPFVALLAVALLACAFFVRKTLPIRTYVPDIVLNSFELRLS